MIWLQLVLRHCQPIRYSTLGNQYACGLGNILKIQLVLKVSLFQLLTGLSQVSPVNTCSFRVSHVCAESLSSLSMVLSFPGFPHIISVCSLLAPNRTTISNYWRCKLFSFILKVFAKVKSFPPVSKQVSLLWQQSC